MGNSAVPLVCVWIELTMLHGASWNAGVMQLKVGCNASGRKPSRDKPPQLAAISQRTPCSIVLCTRSAARADQIALLRSACHSTHERLSLHAIRSAAEIIQMRRDINTPPKGLCIPTT